MIPTRSTRFPNPWRMAGWGLVAALLALPAIAMHYTTEVNWTASDFVFAAVLLGGTGLAFEAAARRTRNLAYRTGAGIAILATLLMTWVNLAVGIIGNEDNDLNMLFLAIVGIELAGVVLARCRPRGMMRAMSVTAACLLTLAAVVGALGHSTAVLIAIFGGAWAVSAMLFARAAAQHGAVDAGVGVH